MDPLARIAAALERMAGIAPPPPADWLGAPAYLWTGTGPRAVPSIEAPMLDQLCGIDVQKAAVAENARRLAQGHAAHDILLWGARGMGKSALVRAAVRAAQAPDPAALALVQVATDALAALPDLFASLHEVTGRRFLVFIDDLGFAEGDDVGPRHLRSWLEGGVEARPAHVRLAVTANHRAILARQAAEQDDPLNPRDAIDDRLALADRFGLSLGFHAASQEDYLAMVAAYAGPAGLAFTAADALEWAKRRGARSGRVAYHYVTELAGRAGRTL